MNEVFIVYLLFTIICLSEFVPDSDVKVYIGHVVCSLISVHLLYNIAGQTYTSFLTLRRYLQLKRARDDQAKYIKLRR